VIAAGIDIGTNTVLLSIAEVNDEEYTLLHEEFAIPRLGELLQRNGFCLPDRIAEVVQVLEFYHHVCKQHKVEYIRVVGTAAMRNASNADAMVGLFSTALGGIPVEVITGHEESRLTFLGSVSGLVDSDDRTPTMMIDIGGGSTELVFSEGKTVHTSISIPYGVVVLRDSIFKHQPITAQQLITWNYELGLALAPYLPLPYYQRCFAVAGTPVAIAALEKNCSDSDIALINSTELSFASVVFWQEYLQSSSTEALYAHSNIEKKRLDVLPVGATILRSILELGTRTPVTVSCFGLRIGAMLTANYALRTY
jgi:exopolyphosphatase / guanosine-5'-triphosphate,3'-diphosphate pyrophosphatase